MVRPVQQIEQELAILDQSVAAITSEFQKAYSQYLAALGKAVRQQLIVASYHLCTHGYPEAFLALPLQQRQDLQQELQRLAKQTQDHLQKQLQPVQTFANLQQRASTPLQRGSSFKVTNSSDNESFQKNTGGHPPLARELGDEPDGELKQTRSRLDLSELELFMHGDLPGATEAEVEIDEVPFPTGADNADLALHELDQAETDRRNRLLDALAGDVSITPNTIAQWQTHLERLITEQLQTLSHTANRLLQREQILPRRLPEPVLEVAAKADLVAESSASPPNLLSLLIETESEEETAVTQLMTIRLRLAEIEFSDTNVGIWRSKIRSLMAQLSKLGREYQKRQKEKAIAQAEAAWRASWFEES